MVAACCSSRASAIFVEVKSKNRMFFVLAMTAMHQKVGFTEKSYANIARIYSHRFHCFTRVHYCGFCNSAHFGS